MRRSRGNTREQRASYYCLSFVYCFVCGFVIFVYVVLNKDCVSVHGRDITKAKKYLCRRCCCYRDNKRDY